MPNASVTLKNCGYYNDNPVITDRDGIFHIVATCNLLIIERITNPATQSDCEPGQKNAEYLLSVQDDPAKMALTWLADIPCYHIASGQKCVFHTYPRHYAVSFQPGLPDAARAAGCI